MIHDGARPLATHRLLLARRSRLRSRRRRSRSCRTHGRLYGQHRCRRHHILPAAFRFRRVQTPQVFKLARLLHAHRAVADHAAFTDDLSVMIAAATAPYARGLRRHQSENYHTRRPSAPRKPLSKAAADARLAQTDIKYT